MPDPVRYTRKFAYGDHGKDVEAVGRALCRAKCGVPLAVFNALPTRVRRTWGRRKMAWLRRFKRRHGLPATPVYGKRAHYLLAPHFDARARAYMDEWAPPLELVEPRQGFRSLHRSLWEAYALGRKVGSDLGTYNGASRLPSGARSDHALYPALAFDIGISPQTGWRNEKARAYFNSLVGRYEIGYVILGDRIWSRGRGLHSYSYGGHENHVHVSGRRDLAYRAYGLLA